MTLAFGSRGTVAFIVFGALVVIGGLLYLTARGELRGRRTSRIPPAMRPAANDEDLERGFIERYLAVGAITTLFLAIWIPVYWLREPDRLAGKRETLKARSIVEGEELYKSLCSSCHGPEAQGAPRSVFIDGKQYDYAEPPLKYLYSRYTEAGRKEEEITQFVYDAINRGRPGTPMPTWGLGFGGALNTAQVDNIVLWLKDIQEDAVGALGFTKVGKNATGAELFAANCAICHGVDGGGAVGPNLRVALDRLTMEQIIKTIHDGRLNSNRPSMPAWAALGDGAIDKLVAFIASIQGA